MESAGVGILQPRDRPAGQDACQRLDIVLRVAAIDAERVQLHHLARQILVEADMTALPGLRIRADREHLVEIEQHRRMPLGGEQHIDEAAGDMRPDRLALESPGEAADDRPHAGYSEMIAPEARQPFLQRRIAIDDRVEARIELGEIDRAQALVLGLLEIGVLVLAEILPRLQHFRDHAGRCGQARIERRGLGIELMQRPAARVLRDRPKLARLRRVAEARRRHEGVR